MGVMNNRVIRCSFMITLVCDLLLLLLSLTNVWVRIQLSIFWPLKYEIEYHSVMHISCRIKCSAPMNFMHYIKYREVKRDHESKKKYLRHWGDVRCSNTALQVGRLQKSVRSSGKKLDLYNSWNN